MHSNITLSSAPTGLASSKEVNDQRIAAAAASLRGTLELETLEGKRFLDVGSGSGLFSLAAHGLGARVVSFDYDRESVACI